MGIYYVKIEILHQRNLNFDKLFHNKDLLHLYWSRTICAKIFAKIKRESPNMLSFLIHPDGHLLHQDWNLPSEKCKLWQAVSSQIVTWPISIPCSFKCGLNLFFLFVLYSFNRALDMEWTKCQGNCSTQWKAAFWCKLYCMKPAKRSM